MTTPLHPTLAAVTTRIEQRSAQTRQAYLDVLAKAKKPGPYRGGMGCANAMSTTQTQFAQQRVPQVRPHKWQVVYPPCAMV